MLRSIYAASNQRTEKLVRQLSKRDRVPSCCLTTFWRALAGAFQCLFSGRRWSASARALSIVLLLPLLNRVGIVAASRQSVVNALIERGLALVGADTTGKILVLVDRRCDGADGSIRRS